VSAPLAASRIRRRETTGALRFALGDLATADPRSRKRRNTASSSKNANQWFDDFVEK